MNNFVIGLKRFFTNKNVITILLVIVILGVLFWGYKSTIEKETNPVTVPVAAREIAPQTKITNDDVTEAKIAGSMLSSNVVRSKDFIVTQYTKVNVTVPEGSVFYTEWLDDEENIPGNWLELLDREADEKGWYMDVDLVSTYGNSVVPNSYIDIYMKATADNGTVMFGRLLKDVKVLVVHDSTGNNVFSSTNEDEEPAHIGFGVNPDTYILLNKIGYLYDVELIISPRGVTPPEEGYAIVTSSTLRDYVDARTITVEEDEITKEEVEETSTQEVKPTA